MFSCSLPLAWISFDLFFVIFQSSNLPIFRPNRISPLKPLGAIWQVTNHVLSLEDFFFFFV